jgi:hypothetical protein
MSEPTTAAEVLRLAVRRAGWDVAEFDRVLAQHDREVAARALRDAADAIPGSNTDERIDPHDRAAEWLIDRADSIERGEGE